MRARYLGPNADLMKVRGSKHNTGEVLHMLLALGVKSAGHWQGAHMSPIDGNAPAVETPAMADGRGNSMNRYDYTFGITVNALGQRFFDEGEAKHAYTYAKTGRAVLQQPGGVAYQIYDQTGIDLFRHGRDYEATMVEAPTLAELAKKIGIEPEPFLHTIKEFNAACRTDVAVHGRRARRQRHGRHHAEEIELGDADREGPVPRLSGDRRRDLQLRRRAGRHPGARHQYLLRADQRPLRVGRRDRAVLPQLSVLHRADPQRRVQLSLRPQRRRDAEQELKRLRTWQKPRRRADRVRSNNSREWVLAPRAQDIPAAAIAQAKLLLLDTIGCGYAAFEEESTEAVLAALKDMGGAPQCTVIGSTTKTSAPNAALVNGSLIRILDLNDYVNTKSGQIGGHPSDNIPVALAAGEFAGASGREILAAIVIGYEIYGRLKEAMDRDGDWDGVTVSGFVAPAMAGRLMGLDARQLAQALALSGARAPTPLAVRHGEISAAKSVANALVAQNGVQATILAKHGMTGPLDLFENQHGLQSIFPDIDGGAHRAAAGRQLHHDVPHEGVPLPRHRPGHRRRRTRPARPDRRRRRPAQADHGRDRRHAVAAAPEGRSRPHRSAIARGCGP